MKRRTWSSYLFFIFALVGCSFTSHTSGKHLATHDPFPYKAQSNILSSHSTLESGENAELVSRAFEQDWYDKVDRLTTLESSTKALKDLLQSPDKAIAGSAETTIRQNQKRIEILRAQILHGIYEQAPRSRSSDKSKSKGKSSSRSPNHRPPNTPIQFQYNNPLSLEHSQSSHRRRTKSPTLRPERSSSPKSSSGDSMPQLESSGEKTPTRAGSATKKTPTKACPSLTEICTQLGTAIRNSPEIKSVGKAFQKTPHSKFTALVAGGITSGVVCMDKHNLGTFASACVVCGAVWCVAIKQWIEEAAKHKEKVKRRDLDDHLPTTATIATKTSLGEYEFSDDQNPLRMIGMVERDLAFLERYELTDTAR